MNKEDRERRGITGARWRGYFFGSAVIALGVSFYKGTLVALTGSSLVFSFNHLGKWLNEKRSQK